MPSAHQLKYYEGNMHGSHTGTNQMYPLGSPMSAETMVPIAATTGTGQNDNP
jgi:hypothetical protein